jgi:NADPH2:quinone reductase
MRAALYTTPGPARDVLLLADRPDPAPAPGEVRVRLAFSGVNPSDVKTRSGASKRGWGFTETVPHSDGAGTVDAVGTGVDPAWMGRRVWVFNGQWERPYGTAAGAIVLPVSQVVPLPDGVPFEVGASIGIPLMTAYHAVQSCGPLLGRTVVVPGAAGSVGYYATQLAALAGARVIAVVSSEAKAELARAAGAHATVNYRSEPVPARVQALTGGLGADAVIEVDAAGNAGQYGNILSFGGRAVIYGSNGPDVAVPFGPMIMGFISLYFFIVYRLPPHLLRETTEGITRLLEAGRLQHPPTAVFELADIAAAHEKVEAGAGAKVLLRL